MKIDRLLGIVVLLLNRKHVTAGELAAYFEVSQRTIYRDIDTLGRSGVPVVTSQGAGGGVELMDGFTLDRQLVSAQDISSIVTALKGLSSILDDQAYVMAREKVESIAGQPARTRMEQDQAIVSIDLTPWGLSDRMRATLNVLKVAAENHEVVAIRYGSSGGEITRREVEPLGLHFKGYSWYLYAYCRLRNDYRLFKLSRIREPAPTGSHFPRRANLPALPQEFLADPREQTQLELCFAPSVRARVEEYFGYEEIEDTAEGLRVCVTWPLDEWVYGFLLSFGPEVTVLRPGTVAEEVRSRAIALARNYPDQT